MTDPEELAAAEAPEMGAALRGIGLNLLVRDVLEETGFLENIFGMRILRANRDFALVAYGDQVFQIHGDHTYHSNPLPSLLPEAGPRGGGIELRLYDTDPETAVAKAETAGAVILQPPADKPHGLREAYILDPSGYCWVPSRPSDPA
ncbi:VOC family protein [Rhodobacteraceae bacterium NNCM2]|nr:VOC family protein [Coraliihabitans acroporae]